MMWIPAAMFIGVHGAQPVACGGEALESMGITPSEVKLTMEPKTTIDVEGRTLTSLLRLLEELEDHDDVQDVFSNMNATDEAMAAAMGD